MNVFSSTILKEWIAMTAIADIHDRVKLLRYAFAAYYLEQRQLELALHNISF